MRPGGSPVGRSLFEQWGPPEGGPDSSLAKSLEDLRTAQDRLVQTEKLASLGRSPLALHMRSRMRRRPVEPGHDENIIEFALDVTK